MGRLRAARRAGALILVAMMATGCAARWAYRQGQVAAEKGDWDLAVARLTRALDKDHKNIGYKIALENARIQASRYHYDQARKHLAANDLAKAVDELQIASNYDPANRSAADDLAIARQKLRKQQEERRARDEFDHMKERAKAATRSPVPVLSPRETAPISMRFEETSIQKIFETLGKLAGVNVLFDDSFRDKKTSVVLTGLSFEQALDRLTLVNRLFYKVLDQNTIIIATESRQNRLKYDELVLRTFYLQNAEINETAQLIKTLAKVTTVGPNKGLGAITVLGTVDQVALAEHIIEANDKARGEVVVEVQILEVNRRTTRDWGLALSNYTASAALNPSGGDVSSTLSIRPYLLSSLNQADWIVNIPSQILSQFLQTEDTARILAAPRLRAAEGKKTEMKIGTEVPVPVTSIGVGLGSSQQGNVGGYYPATSFQYKTVGVTMSLTPQVSASGDITLEVNAEFSLLGGTSNLGTQTNPLNIPQFLTRAVNATLRLRDGETGLIGGLLQGRESKTFSGSIGMNDIPIIGKLLGTRHKEGDDTEILMSLTPHIVRAPKLTEEDFIPLSVGTQAVPHVAGARPPLFGPEEPAAQAGTAEGAETPGAPPAAPVAPAAPVPARPPVASPPSPAGPTLAPSAAPGPELPSTDTAAPPAAALPAPASPAAATPPATTPAPAPTLMLSPPQVSLRVGQLVGISLVLVGGRDVEWVEMTLVYDPALAEVTDMASGSLLTLDGKPVQADRAIEPGRARVRFTRATPVTGSGGVVAITLRGLRPGSGALSVESVTVGRASGPESVPPPSAARLVVTP